MIKSCHNDAGGKSKDHSEGICPDPVDSVPEACMPTHEDPSLPALSMVPSFDAQDLADKENLKLAKLMATYKESVHFTMPTSTTLAISSVESFFVRPETCCLESS